MDYNLFYKLRINSIQMFNNILLRNIERRSSMPAIEYLPLFTKKIKLYNNKLICQL